MKYLSDRVSYTSTDILDLTLWKKFLRQDHADDDDLLLRLARAASMEAESYVQIALFPQVRRVVFRQAPAADIELDFGPVLGVTSVTHYDDAGNATVVDPADYAVDSNRVTVLNAWPFIGPGESIKLVYTAGTYDDTVSPVVPVPADVETAIYMLGQALYARNPQDNDMLKTAAFRMLDTVREGQGV